MVIIWDYKIGVSTGEVRPDFQLIFNLIKDYHEQHKSYKELRIWR